MGRVGEEEMKVNRPNDIPNADYKEALLSLLYQLADDDFILAYRGSEWLGLAPHIEEDVAFSSINQDTMGHATMFYHLLEELGKGIRTTWHMGGRRQNEGMPSCWKK